MYLIHFDLRQHPFANKPDPEIMIWTEQHKKTREKLLESVFGKPTVTLLSGEYGSGKTAHIKWLLQSPDVKEKCHAVLVSTGLGSGIVLLQTILMSFLDSNPECADDEALLILRREIAKAAERKRKTLIVVDDAQNMAPEAAKMLARIVDDVEDKAYSPSVILAGQPQITTLLQEPEFKSLRSAIGDHLKLGRLSKDDVGEFITDRLELAGYTGAEVFDGGAIDLIHNYAQGIPRLINKACDTCLDEAFKRNIRTVSKELAAHAISKLAADAGASDASGGGDQVDQFIFDRSAPSTADQQTQRSAGQRRKSGVVSPARIAGPRRGNQPPEAAKPANRPAGTAATAGVAKVPEQQAVGEGGAATDSPASPAIPGVLAPIENKRKSRALPWAAMIALCAGAGGVWVMSNRDIGVNDVLALAIGDTRSVDGMTGSGPGDVKAVSAEVNEQTKTAMAAEETRLASLRQEANRALQELETLDQNVSSLRAEKQSLDAEVLTSRQELVAAQDEFRALSDQLAVLGPKAEQDQTAHRVLLERIAGDRDQLGSLEKEILERQSLLDEMNQDLAANRHQLENMRQELATGADQRASLDEEMMDGQTRVAALNEEIAAGQQRLAIVTNDIETGEGRLASLDGETIAAQTRLGALNDDIVAKQDTLGSLSQDVSEAQTRLGTLKDEIASAQNQLASVNAENTREQERLDTLTYEISVGENRLAGLGDELLATQDQLASQARDIADGQAVLEALAGDIAAQQDHLRSLTVDVQMLQDEIATVTPKLAEKQNELAALTQEVTQGQAQLGKLAEDIASAQALLASLTESIDAGKAEIASLGRALSSKTGQLATLEADFAARQGDLGELVDDLTNRQDQLAGLNDEIDAKQDELAVLQDRLKNSVERYETLNNRVVTVMQKLEELDADKTANIFTDAVVISTPEASGTALPRRLELATGTDEHAAVYFEAALESTDPKDIALNYARAALRGHERAATYLGQLYATGDGLTFDLDIADRWYQVAEDPALLHDAALVSDTDGAGPEQAYPLAFVVLDGSAEFLWHGRAIAFTLELADATGTPIGSAWTPLTAIRVTLPEEAAFWRVVTESGQSFDWQPLDKTPE